MARLGERVLAMGFSFTATARCERCGQLLQSSDEECDHDGEPVDKHVFRRLAGGRDSLIGVKTTPSWKWQRLKEKVEDDWIAYEYLGTKSHVNAMLQDVMWSSVEELPRKGMSIHAPNSVEEYEVDT